MKNIFSWSVLLSMFTIFFYWFGYWYTQGYIFYFGYDIEAYDIPIQHILISGFLKSPIETIIFVVILIIISFISQFTRNQKKYFLHVFSKIVIYIFFFLSLGIRKITLISVNSAYDNVRKAISSERRINKIVKMIFIIIVSTFILPCFILLLVAFSVPFIFILLTIFFLRIIARLIYRIVQYCSNLNSQVLNKQIIQELGVNIESIEKDIDVDKSHNFDVLYSTHSILLIVLLFSLLVTLKLTIDINKKGLDDAKIIYNCSMTYNKSECSNRFNIIEVENVRGSLDSSEIKEKWYLTNICVEQKCVVINENKTTKLVDITDKNITIQ